MTKISVSTILRASFLGFTLAIGVLLALSARSAWTEFRTARQVQDIARIAAPLLDSLLYLRLDRGNSFRDLKADVIGLTERTRELRLAGRSAAERVVSAIEQSSISDRDARLAEFTGARDRLFALMQEVDAALEQTDAARRGAVAERWRDELTSQINANFAFAGELGTRVQYKDPVVDALLASQSAALDARSTAGEASLLVSNATSGVALPDDATRRFYGSTASALASLKMARSLLGDLPLSPGLAKAFTDTDAIYNAGFRELSERQFLALQAGTTPPLALPEWMAATLPTLDAIASIAIEALAQAEVAAAETAAAAEMHVYRQLGFLGIGLVLAALLLFLVGRRVTSPLGVVTERMRLLADGQLDTQAPFVDRQDEIGALGRALALFRENALETERLRQREAEKERDAAEMRRADMMRLADSFDEAVGSSVSALTQAAERLKSTASGLSSVAERTSGQAIAVAAASEQASANVASVAGATEELSSSVTEIRSQAGRSSEIAETAVAEVEETNKQVAGLAAAAERVGSIVIMIEDVAAKTNLLALNATIEAARAGEAGKGFAVVAGEVKQLADQTARATSDISRQIADMQAASLGAAEAIKAIGETIRRMSDISSEIFDSVGSQGQATVEIARNVAEASTGTADVSRNISGVTAAASDASEAASEVLAAASQLSDQSAALSRQIESFLGHVRAA